MSKLSHSPIDSDQPLDQCDRCHRMTRVEDMGDEDICTDCINQIEEFRREERLHDDEDFYWREW